MTGKLLTLSLEFKFAIFQVNDLGPRQYVNPTTFYPATTPLPKCLELHSWGSESDLTYEFGYCNVTWYRSLIVIDCSNYWLPLIISYSLFLPI